MIADRFRGNPRGGAPDRSIPPPGLAKGSQAAWAGGILSNGVLAADEIGICGANTG